jgi:HAD superfamily hydrolase (TIGR01509 family)
MAKLVPTGGFAVPTWPRPIRAVVFDLDGLIFNTEELYVEVGDRLLRRRGHRVSQPLLDQMMGRPSPVALQIMIDWHRLDATVEELMAETAAIFDEILDSRLSPMPGFLELLTALETRNTPRAVATSSTRRFAHRVLNQFGLLPRFAFVLTCEDVQHGKPHPEIYHRAASRFGVEPGEMLVLEDSALGCQAAVASGACTVAVPGPHNPHHEYPGAFMIARGLHDPRLWELLDLQPLPNASGGS